VVGGSVGGGVGDVTGGVVGVGLDPVCSVSANDPGGHVEHEPLMPNEHDPGGYFTPMCLPFTRTQECEAEDVEKEHRKVPLRWERMSENREDYIPSAQCSPWILQGT
jgi:hypothetical protein